MASVISASDLNELRAFQNSLMEATCRIDRPLNGERVLNEDTGMMERPEQRFIFEGVCRYATTRGPGIIAAGEGVAVVGTTDIFIPWDAPIVPQVDDLVTITEAPDPPIVGKTFTVLFVPQTQYLTARKMVCQALQSSRLRSDER